MRVEVHLYTQSEPVQIENVRNAYTKGPLYCVMLNDGDTTFKFPLEHIFRVKEVIDSLTLRRLEEQDRMNEIAARDLMHQVLAKAPFADELEPRQ